MKTTRNKIILNGLMAVALLATSGCWTQHGNQPNGSGQAGGSVRSSDRPIKTNGAFASDGADARASREVAQLAANSNGSRLFPLNP